MKAFGIMLCALVFQVQASQQAAAASWPPEEGASLDATVTQSSRCGPPRPDDSPCWKLALQIATGQQLADLRLYQFVKILDASGNPGYTHPALKPDGTLSRDIAPGSPEGRKLLATFNAAAAGLKKGARVHVEIMTCQAPDRPPGKIQCEAASVRTLR